MASLAPRWASSTSWRTCASSGAGYTSSRSFASPSRIANATNCAWVPSCEVTLDAAKERGRRVDSACPRGFEVAHPSGDGVGTEQPVDEPAIDVDGKPHRPRRDEEEHDAGGHDERAVDDAAAPNRKEAGVKHVVDEAVDRRLRVTPLEERIAEAGEGVPPDADREPDVEERSRGPSPPRYPIAFQPALSRSAACSQANRPRGATKGSRILDVFGEEVAGEVALQAPEPPRRREPRGR